MVWGIPRKKKKGKKGERTEFKKERDFKRINAHGELCLYEKVFSNAVMFGIKEHLAFDR